MSAPPTRRRARATRADVVIVASAVVLTTAAALLHAVSAGSVGPFVVSALALAALAALVARSVEQIGDRLGSGATGVLQSALGNLPELFVGIFALRAGLLTVLQAALIGSILANVLLVLGLAFLLGGLRHGTQRFDRTTAGASALLLVISTAGLLVPTLAVHLSTPVAGHVQAFSYFVAAAMLVVFIAALPTSLRRGGERAAIDSALVETPWSFPTAVVALALSSVAAAFVADWFVAALSPAIEILHISPEFAGLVIVAIAGNAVENVVGIRLALKNEMDFALSVILQSPVQIALVLIPVLVLISSGVGPTHLSLALPPLLAAVMAIAALVAEIVVIDGESTALEGCGLLVVYAVIAGAFWWG